MLDSQSNTNNNKTDHHRFASSLSSFDNENDDEDDNDDDAHKSNDQNSRHQEANKRENPLLGGKSTPTRSKRKRQYVKDATKVDCTTGRSGKDGEEQEEQKKKKRRSTRNTNCKKSETRNMAKSDAHKKNKNKRKKKKAARAQKRRSGRRRKRHDESVVVDVVPTDDDDDEASDSGESLSSSSSSSSSSSCWSTIIDEPHDHDVLFGRGPKQYRHNRHTLWKKLIDESKLLYMQGEKEVVVKSIIDHVRSIDPPTRFLIPVNKNNHQERGSGKNEEKTKKNSRSYYYRETHNETRILQKTMRALRQDNQEIKDQMLQNFLQQQQQHEGMDLIGRFKGHTATKLHRLPTLVSHDFAASFRPQDMLPVDHHHDHMFLQGPSGHHNNNSDAIGRKHPVPHVPLATASPRTKESGAHKHAHDRVDRHRGYSDDLDIAMMMAAVVDEENNHGLPPPPPPPPPPPSSDDHHHQRGSMNFFAQSQAFHDEEACQAAAAAAPAVQGAAVDTTTNNEELLVPAPGIHRIAARAKNFANGGGNAGSSSSSNRAATPLLQVTCSASTTPELLQDACELDLPHPLLGSSATDTAVRRPLLSPTATHNVTAAAADKPRTQAFAEASDLPSVARVCPAEEDAGPQTKKRKLLRADLLLSNTKLMQQQQQHPQQHQFLQQQPRPATSPTYTEIAADAVLPNQDQPHHGDHFCYPQQQSGGSSYNHHHHHLKPPPPPQQQQQQQQQERFAALSQLQYAMPNISRGAALDDLILGTKTPATAAASASTESSENKLLSSPRVFDSATASKLQQQQQVSPMDLLHKVQQGVDNLQEIYNCIMVDNKQNDAVLEGLTEGITQVTGMMESIQQQQQTLQELCDEQCQEQGELSCRIQNLEEKLGWASLQQEEQEAEQQQQQQQQSQQQHHQQELPKAVGTTAAASCISPHQQQAAQYPV